METQYSPPNPPTCSRIALTCLRLGPHRRTVLDTSCGGGGVSWSAWYGQWQRGMIRHDHARHAWAPWLVTVVAHVRRGSWPAWGDHKGDAVARG